MTSDRIATLGVERTEVILTSAWSRPGCKHVGMTELPSIPNAGSILIADLTGDAVVRVAAGATVADVAKVIADNQVGAVVVGDQARPTALVTERDVVKVVASGKDPATVHAADVASTHLVWCERRAVPAPVPGTKYPPSM